MKIGDKIRHIRQLKNFSQQNMADFLEISLNTYAAVEQNKSDITLSRLEKIAHIFEIPIEEIFAFGASKYFQTLNNPGGFNGNYISNVPLTETEKMDQRLTYLETQFTTLEKQLSIIIQNLTK